MKATVRLLKLTLCGPGDVMKEMAIAQEIVAEWNRQHGEARRLWIKDHHWRMDTYPALGDRPQAIVNGQIIDEADIIVAVFWSRFGTPTGAAASGTQEEIIRGIRLGRKVMVYFSDLEPLPRGAQQEQVERLAEFRRELRSQGLCESFQSRQQFREKFGRGLSLAINQLHPAAAAFTGSVQTVVGDGNTVVGGDLNVFTKTPMIRPVVERRPGSVTNAEANRIQAWIRELAEGTARMSRKRAFQMWWMRFRKRLKIEKYEELPSSRMPEAEAWYKQQRGIQISGLKTRAPKLWRDKRMGSIKQAMKRMGRTNQEYYPELAARLKMRAFTSLTELTKTDLDRVHNIVLRDAGFVNRP